MSNAKNIDGTFIGHRIGIYNGDTYRYTDEVTMVLHKKNGNVQIRHGKNNRQVELRPGSRVWKVPHGAKI